ncbi:MAG: hypothetical protein E5V89_05385 [Mesorhizobium sp.]|nr:MAG: hypothetical protein E5V89_05385 [Mesorhizobium sp.]
MRGAGRSETLEIWHHSPSVTKVLAKLEHPSSVSALRADPPFPTRGEGRISASPSHAARISAPPRPCRRRAHRARRSPYARWSCRRASGRRHWRRHI